MNGFSLDYAGRLGVWQELKKLGPRSAHNADSTMFDRTIFDVQQAAIWLYTVKNLTTIQKMLDHSNLQATAVYARLDLKALEPALQKNADCFFSA